MARRKSVSILSSYRFLISITARWTLGQWLRYDRSVEISTGDNAKKIFTALGEGEKANGVDTIGDRAVAGMRRMIGTTGVDDTMTAIFKGGLKETQVEALKTLVGNPDKTLGMCSTSRSTFLYTKLGESVTGQND
jgi:hypothetical protein